MRTTISILGKNNIRKIEPSDYPSLLALNNSFHKETSLLDKDEWAKLVENAYFARQFGLNLGLLITYASGFPFANANFNWFLQRFKKFVYVDRIVISKKAQGLGAGRALYEHLFEEASQAGYARITCEVNEMPPNPGSDAFHKKLGFKGLESVHLAGKKKTVRYMAKTL